MSTPVPPSSDAVLAGAEPWSHHAPAADGEPTTGVLALHGFTGNPSSMRGFAQAMAAAGHHVELPRLPGHGTTVEEMITTRWADWVAEVETAYQRLAERTDRVVVAGLSMGGSLALATAFAHPEVGGAGAGQPGHAAPGGRGDRDARRDAGRRDGRRAGHRQRHRRPRRGRDLLRRHAAAAAAVVHARRTGTDGRSLRRIDDAAAVVDLSPGSRGRADARASTSPPPTAVRSITAGWSAATTSPPRTSTATRSSSSRWPGWLVRRDRRRSPARPAARSTSARSRSTPTG